MPNPVLSFVPPELTGVWRRQLITAPGLRDDTTAVYWVQTRSWYADLRVPADRPHAAVRHVAAYGDEDLARLARVEGFCGQLTATHEVCAWRRDLDFQPPAATPDEGTWTLSCDVMIERGVHLDYEEVWRREPQSDGALLAFELAEDPEHPGRTGLLVVAGDHFLRVLDRTAPLPQGANLSEIVAREGRAAAAALAMPIAYGRIAGGEWAVRLSSEPWREGAPLADAMRLEQVGQEVRLVVREGTVARTWRLLDSSVPADELAAALPFCA